MSGTGFPALKDSGRKAGTKCRGRHAGDSGVHRMKGQFLWEGTEKTLQNSRGLTGAWKMNVFGARSSREGRSSEQISTYVFVV